MSKALFIFNSLKKKFSEFKQNDEDGLRIDFEDSWVNLRSSNTEPIIRIITEAKSKEKVNEIQKSVLKHFKSVV